MAQSPTSTAPSIGCLPVPLVRGHVAVTLRWRDVTCGIASISDPDVCAWNPAGAGTWKNMGNAAEAGTTVTGTARTEKTSSFYGAYTWGNFSGIRADAGPDRVMEVGDTMQIGAMNQAAWDYDWTPSGTVEEPDSAITRAYPTIKTEYILEVTGENSCTATDTAIVFITVMPEDTARSSLDFVVNNGQIIDTDGAPRPDIGIYSHQASPMVYCGDNRVSFVHSKIDTIAATPDTLARVDINFHETYRDAEPLGMGLNSHHYNYYYAHCPEGVTLTPSYNRVVYPQLYENTDLHIKGNNAWMKFEFVIHPGGDPEDILMTFEGADNVEVIQSLGLLIVTSSVGTYIFPKPTALKIDTVGAAVELGWQPDWDLSVEGDTVRFANIGSYNPAEVLIFTLGEEPFAVAPHVLDNHEWQTSYGGHGREAANDVHTDTDGHPVFVGYTESAVFPQFDGQATFNNELSGGLDAFVAKFEAPEYTMSSGNDGDRLRWATYYGGTGNDIAHGVLAVGDHDNGQIYFVGEAEGGIDVVQNGFPQQYSGGTDAFVAELRSDNGTALWITYFGGTSDVSFSGRKDIAQGLDLSDDGSLLSLVGITNSNVYFPLQNPGNGAYFQPAIIGNSTSSGFWDGFISVFDVSPDVTILEHEITSSSSLQVYPNPSFGEISILSKQGKRGTMTIEVFSSLGVKVATYSKESLPNQSVTITLPEDIVTGVYHFRIALNNTEFNKRLVYVSP